MPERVVDALEAIEVEAEHGKALPTSQAQKRLLQLLAEQRAVGEVGQCVMARKVRDLLLLAAAVGDVLVQRHPAAAFERLGGDRDDAVIAELDRHGPGVTGIRRVGLPIRGVVPRTVLLPVIPERAVHRPRAGQMVRQPVHRGELPVADQQARLGIEHAQAQRHVVDRRVELEIEPLELALLLQKLDRFGLENRHRAGKLPHLVLVGEARDVDRGVVAREAEQRPADALQARQHAA